MIYALKINATSTISLAAFFLTLAIVEKEACLKSKVKRAGSYFQGQKRVTLKLLNMKYFE